MFVDVFKNIKGLTFTTLAVFLCGFAFGNASNDNINAKAAGFDSGRLQHIETVLQEDIDQSKISGAVALVARKGNIAYLEAFGLADVEAGQEMETDSIFRIASMSKAVTAVAALILYEEGRFLLSDPLSKYIPEFANPTVSVVSTSNPSGFITRPAARELQVRDLFTHQAGLEYGGGAAANLWAANDVGYDFLFNNNETIADYVKRLADMPLTADPGTVVQYGIASDVLGYFVEVVSGQSFDQFLYDRIFQPLNMNDTSFYLPLDKVDRFTALYENISGDDPIQLFETAQNSAFVQEPRTFFSGAGGLLSTAKDYMKFCQMIINGGTYKGDKILGRKTVEMLFQVHSGEYYQTGLRELGDKNSLAFGIRTERGERSELESIGTLTFAGSFFTRYWIDESEDIVIVLMAQNNTYNFAGVLERVKNIVYASLD